MKNLVPQFIIEQFIQGHFHGRFHAATLFVDISGFTAITNVFMRQGKEGGEAMADMMQAVFDPLVQAVYTQGGFITGFAGDAFTAVFPTDTPREPHAFYRVLTAAVTMQQYLRDNPTQQTSYGDFHFSIKIGLAEGSVEWGIVGEHDFEDMAHLGEFTHAFYFRGTAIDGCAEAEQQAVPGEILLAHHLYLELVNHVRAVGRGKFWQVTAVTVPLSPPQRTYTLPFDQELLTTFIPEIILQQQARGEFRHVTTLFLNLRDIYTNEQLAPFIQTIFKLIKIYGGYLNTINFGDKGCTLLLFWGMPVSYENDIERTLNFVQALVQQTQVVFRAGITYRLMYAGFVGASQKRQEYSCYGRGINLAARLMEAAPWGEIWVDHALVQRGQQLFSFMPQGPISLKGFAEPQPVYVFSGSREEAHFHFRGRMVGRQRELARMAKFAHPLQNGRFAGLLIIQGEAGIGKSRLVNAFQRSNIWRQYSPPPQWFHSHADEILRQAFNPFRTFLKRYFQQSATVSAAVNKERFRRKLYQLIRHSSEPWQQNLVRVRPFLGMLIDLQWDDQDYTHIEGKARFDNVVMALQTLLQAESLRQPVILHIEDTHWLDGASWECLRQLSHTLANYPVGIILTARDSQTDTLTQFSVPITTINLTSLGEAGLAELAANLLGHPPSPRMVRLLVERSDGNPFFAEQILLYLREQEPPLSDVDPGLTAMLLPLDVRAILIARIDQLAQSVKEVVQRAAILGREFDVQVLSYLLHDMPNVHEKVLDAERASIWVAVNQLRYLFKHALLRDAAYDMQLQGRRRELHRLTAAVLEQIYTHELPSHYGELVYHYGQAQMEHEERHYAMLAAQQAIVNYAHEEALRYLNRALALTPTTDTRTQFALLLQREEVYHLQGKRDLQEIDLCQLSDLATEGSASQKGAALVRRARYADVISDYPASAAAAQAAIQVAAADKDQMVAANGRLHLGIALWRQGHYPEAVVQLNQALVCFQELEDQRDAATTRNFLGIIAYERGEYELSKANYQELLAIRRAAGDRVGEASTLSNLGAIANFQGDFTQAQTYFQQALTIRRETGHRQGEGALLLNLGVTKRNMGEYTAAQTYLEQSLPISREVGERTMESVVLMNLALLYHQMGAQETSVTYGHQALTMMRTLNGPLFYSATLTWLAHALTALDQFNEARQHYEEAITIRRMIGQTHIIIEPLAGLARIALAIGDDTQAYEYGKEMRRLLKRNPNLHGTEEPFRIYLTCYHGLHIGHDARAQQVLQVSYKLLQQRATTYTNENQRTTFLQISAHQDLIQTWLSSQKPFSSQS